ncbi:hypothetical protein SEA_JUSTBECAUSE_245 [Streptomyces phage JustBecause]|nr:hypothetical protein SEA_JUSTBECAUSE_245 [Streptomyces phage JustBecause]
MLSVIDVLELLAEGKKLPQEELPAINDQQIHAIQEAEPALLNRLIEAEGNGEDPVDAVMSELRRMAGEHGWYATTGTLCMLFSQRYSEDIVPHLSSVSVDTMSLLKVLPAAGRAMKEDEGAWTIPLAMLTSLGEEGALEFTACAALCAAMGHIQSGLEQEAGR